MYMCVKVHIFACVARDTAERDAAVAQRCSPSRMTYMQGTPMGVQTYTVCVGVSEVPTMCVCVYVCVSARLCVSLLTLSCVLAAACLPRVFRRNSFVVLAYSFFVPPSVLQSVTRVKIDTDFENVSPNLVEMPALARHSHHLRSYSIVNHG